METYLLLMIFGLILGVFLIIITNKYFNWTEKITSIRENRPNSVLGYFIAFDSLVLILTFFIIIIAIILYTADSMKDKKELIVLILGLSIGSIITRTPSFKEKIQPTSPTTPKVPPLSSQTHQNQPDISLPD